MPEEKPNPFLTKNETAEIEKPNPFMDEAEKKNSASQSERENISPSESKSDSVTPLAHLNDFYPPSESETPSIKSKQSNIVQEHTKQQFLTNPLFQESNPNAEKNKQIWIDTLAKKGYDKGDLELINKATNKAKATLPEKGFWDKTEGEISRDFWNKTTDAALEGYNQVKQAFSEPLKTEEGKPLDANTPITQIDIAKPITKAIVGGTTALFSPIIGAFGEATDAIKSAADKTLPAPAAKVVGEALPTVFSLAHKAADALGYNPKEDSSGEHLLSIADMLIGGKALHVGGKAIKSVVDLKNVSQEAANGKLNSEELKSYENVVEEIKNSSLSDVKKAAEAANTPQGDVIASKISDIEKPSAEHIAPPELQDLQKQKENLESDKANLESKQPGSGEILNDEIKNVDSKIEEAHKNITDNHAGEGLANVLHSEIDSKIQGLESTKEGLSESGKQALDKQIDILKEQKAAIPEATIEGETNNQLQNESKNEIREIKQGQRQTENERVQSEGKNDGQKTNEEKINNLNPQENATQEINQQEGVQGERKSGSESQSSNKTGSRNSVLGETSSAEEKVTHKPISELTDEEYVDKFVNSGLFNPVGDVYQERLDLGMSTAEIKKAISDIKNGKDSAPALKLKEAILKTKQTNTVPIITGTGGKASRFNRNLSDYSEDIESAPTDLTESEIKLANNISPKLADAINEEGITSDNIDNLIVDNAGEFPYSNEDLQTIKNYLNEQRRQETSGNVENETVITPSESVGEKTTGETRESKVSGIKKALVPEDVNKPNSYETASDKELLEMGKSLVENKEVNPEKIIEDVNNGEKVVLDPKEVSALIYHKATLDKALKDAYAENDEAKIKELNDDIYEYNVMSLITAQQQSLAFRLRQGLRDSNTFDVVNEINRYKQNNKGKIPKEVEEKFKAIGQELESLKQKISDLESEKEKISEQESVDKIVESVERKKSPKKNYTEQSKQLADKFRKKYKSKDNKFTIKDESGNDIEIDVKINGVGQDAIVELIAKAIEKTGSIADAIVNVTEQLKEKEWYKNLSKENQSHLKKQIIDSIKEEQGTLITKEDGKLNIPSKLIREQVEKGVKDIDKLTDVLHEEIIKDFPDTTKREVRDAITGYGKEVGRTRDELSSEINKLKRLGKLISKKEDLQSGKVSVKEKITKVDKEALEAEVQKEIKVLEDELGVTENKRLEQAKNRIEKRIGEFEKMIREGDYSKKQKPSPVIADTELTKLKSQKEALEAEVQKEQYKNELKNRTFGEKAQDAALEIFSALPRVLVASIDFSAIGVQGALRAFRHPIEAKNALKEMFKQFASEKYHEQWLNDIKAQSWYPEMKQSKLALTEADGKMSAKEEKFISNWINHIWELPATALEKAISENKASEAWKKLNPYKASERAFTGYLNSIRVQAYLEGAKYLKQQGVSYASNPKAYAAWADFVNNSTGRASLGKLELSNKLLQTAFFSVRKMAATANLFANPNFYIKMPKEVRQKAILEMASSVAIIGTTTALIRAATGDKHNDFFDLNSTNFMKLRVKGKNGSYSTINFWGSAQTQTTALSRLISGKYRGVSGKKETLGERPITSGVNSRLDVITNFFKNKLSPGVTIPARLLDQKKGRELDYKEEALKDFTPMWTQDINDLYKDHPKEIAGLLNFLAVFGVTVQHYKKPK